MQELKEDKHSLTDSELRSVIRLTVNDTLTQLGVDFDKPLEMQKDFQHLREMRTSTEAMKRKGMLTLMGVFIMGIVVAVKSYFEN